MKSAKYITLALITLFHLSYSLGQVAKDTELYIELKEKDSALFNAAFNTCDTEIVKKLFTEDFEFYHDKGGLTEGRKNFLDPMAENCSNRKPGDPPPSKRILVENSLEVYPMHKNGELYGALQQGIHRFEFMNNQKEYQKGDIAKFIHVWVLENEEWKIKRELSYDHQPDKN